MGSPPRRFVYVWCVTTCTCACVCVCVVVAVCVFLYGVSATLGCGLVASAFVFVPLSEQQGMAVNGNTGPSA